MRTIYKYFLFTITILFVIFGSTYSFADVNTDSFSCDDIWFSIVGPDAVIVGSGYTYWLSVAFLDSSLTSFDSLDAVIVPQDIISDSKVRHELIRSNKVLQRSTDLDFDPDFSALWTYTVRSTVSYKSCSYTLEKDVGAYKSIYVYVWQYIDDFNFGIIQNIKQNDVLLRTFIITDEMIANPTMFMQMIRQQRSYLSHANDIYFSLKNYSLVFDVLLLLDKDPLVGLSSKNVFIVDDTNKSIAKKFLARFVQKVKPLWLYIISPDEMIDMFLQLSIGKQPYSFELIQDSLLQFSWSKFGYSFSHVVDYLLFQWFPLDMLMLILSCVVAVLLIVFVKQFIGISSYGVYYPLIFAIAIHVVWLKTSLFLLFVAFVAKMFVIMFTRRLTLLATAKLWLQIVLYIFLTVFGLVVLKSLNLLTTDFVIFTNPMMLLAYFAILLMASKIWTSSLTTISVKQASSVWWFLLLSLLCYAIIQSGTTHYVVLLYPGIVFLVILLLIWFWRYTGLQLMEYIRFWPLIDHIRKKK